MGEEEIKRPEETKKAEEEKVEKKEEPTKDEKPTDGKNEENNDEAKEAAPQPPPPPQEIILRVYMHCEGCARKVRRCLKGFDGVEDVMTDCRTSSVVVKGEKADPIKVLEKVQRKSHRQVDLLSPIPPPPPPATEEPKKPEEKEEVKTEEKIEEPPVVTVLLRVHMHCEACAQEIRKRIQRMKGVESAEPDLKKSEVTVKGAFEPEKLVEYVHKRTGKQAVIVKVEPEKQEEEEKGKDKKEEKKPAEEGEKESKKGDEGGKENKDGDGNGGGGDEPPGIQEAEVEEAKMELKKNEFYQYQPQNYQIYPQRIAQGMDSYPPQIFSDENPNACSVM